MSPSDAAPPSDTPPEDAAAPPAATLAESDLVATVREAFGDALRDVEVNRGALYEDQWTLVLEREALVDVVRHLGETLGFDFLVDVTGLDHYGEEPRFRAVYVLRSMDRREDVVLQVEVPEEDCWAPSLVPLFETANWHEREAYDMFGITFRGHPDLRRIMMPEVFEDFPLRKDFPMEGKMTDQEWAAWIIERAQRLEGDH